MLHGASASSVVWLFFYLEIGLMGGRVSTVMRALAFCKCGPGLISARCHVRVEFVGSSRLAAERFSLATLVSLPPEKPTLQIPISSG